MSIAKHIVERDEPGLYATRYRNPHDGHLYVGPQIRASGRDEAERIASQLSYSGQPVTVDGLLVDEFPASLADPAARAEIKSAIAAEVQRVIDESADGKAGGGR